MFIYNMYLFFNLKDIYNGYMKTFLVISNLIFILEFYFRFHIGYYHQGRLYKERSNIIFLYNLYINRNINY